MSLTNWLELETIFPKFYWSSRDSSFEVAGVGIMDESDYPKSGYFGFLRFSDVCEKNSPWKKFGKSRFIKPLKIRLGNKNLIQLTTETNPLFHKNFPCIKESAWISNDSWNKKIKFAIDLMEENHIEKIVLANKFEIINHFLIKPIKLLKQLQIKLPNAYHFLFQLSDDLAFLGASPERLYQRDGRSIYTEALAGTKPIDVDTHKFINDKKEIREHEIVIKDILKSMKSISRANKITNLKEIIKLTHIQHIRTQLSGILFSETTDLDILQALHPTAAICGWPRRAAYFAIKNIETFDRGLYAGAIGFIAEEKSEFSVSIRSALVNNNSINIFGGAGIIKTSNAENEWLEIKNKTKFWKELF